MDFVNASQLITDEYAAKILVATYRRPKSAIELSHKLGIPIAACYRRIHSLEKAGFLVCTEKVLTQKGKRMGVYLSNLKNAQIQFTEGKIKVSLEMKAGENTELRGEWDIADLIEQ